MQGDTVRHGGPEKAVHYYPFDHYAFWTGEFGEQPILAKPGALGENIATLGLTEEEAAIGDVFRLGSAVIEISQGRQPCWKLNERFARKAMVCKVQETGRTGWYYRVIEPGTVVPGVYLSLLERRSPEWTLARIWSTSYVKTFDRSELTAIAGLSRLAFVWRAHAAKRLESGKVEDWTRRLQGIQG